MDVGLEGPKVGQFLQTSHMDDPEVARVRFLLCSTVWNTGITNSVKV